MKQIPGRSTVHVGKEHGGQGLAERHLSDSLSQLPQARTAHTQAFTVWLWKSVVNYSINR